MAIGQDLEATLKLVREKMLQEFPGEDVVISEKTDPENGGTYHLVAAHTGRGVDDSLDRLDNVFSWWFEQKITENLEIGDGMIVMTVEYV